MTLFLLTLAFSSLPAAEACDPGNPGYNVEVLERSIGPGGGSLVSFANSTSAFPYNCNPAYFPAPPNGGGNGGLIIRVGNRASYGKSQDARNPLFMASTSPPPHEHSPDRACVRQEAQQQHFRVCAK